MRVSDSCVCEEGRWNVGPSGYHLKRIGGNCNTTTILTVNDTFDTEFFFTSQLLLFCEIVFMMVRTIHTCYVWLRTIVYYDSNENGSTYYNSGSGYSSYTPSGGKK